MNVTRLNSLIVMPSEETKSNNVIFDNDDNNQIDEKVVIQKKEIIYSRLYSIITKLNPLESRFIKPFIDIAKNEGILAIYKGVFSSVICSIFQNGSQFFFAKIFQHLFKLENTKVSNIIIINLLAAIFTAIITNPIEVLNTRIVVNKNNNIGNIEQIKKIISIEGWKGLYKGILPSLILTTYPVINMTIYGYLKSKITNSEDSMSNKDIIVISFISKFLTTLINYPLLIIKSCFQANDNENKSVLDHIKLINKTRGILGFYKGFLNKMSTSQFNSILLMLIYEKLQEYVRFAVFAMLFGFKITLNKPIKKT